MTMYFSDIPVGAESVEVVSEKPFRTGSFYNNHMKRWIDVALVVAALPLIVPLVLLMAALVALDGHNPFYSQARIGRNGKVFRIWKIRTMVPDADDVLEAYLAASPAARAEWDAAQKLLNDPRITWIGHVFRKSSLDELPQLLNVLNGSMSLVGPRPMMVCQKTLYPGRAYYTLRPGITGLWQVSDRNDCTFAGRAVFDDCYACSISFGTDLRVLLQTVGVVVRATGH